MKIANDFFKQDVLEVCPKLIGKYLVRQFDNGEIFKEVITEVEAYRGEEDLGCHASKGMTPRTSVMYDEGGLVYVYLVYGMYWMLNFVTGEKGNPQAVLIRNTEKVIGPGRIGKKLMLDKTFYGEKIGTRIWIEENPNISDVKYKCDKRIGIDYAKEWKDKLWRYILQ